MEDIEAIDLFSSDSDDSQSKDSILQSPREQNEDSFVSKRIQDVVQDHSTILFEDNEVENLLTTTKPVSRTLPISKDLLDRKRVQHCINDEEEKNNLKRTNSNIPKGSSPVSTEVTSSVPSALNVVGVTEEEDKLNTSEVRHIIASYSTKMDCSDDSLDSMLSSNSMEPSSLHDSHLGQHDVELSEEDFSILQPYHESSTVQPDHSTVQSDPSHQNQSFPISILSDDSDSKLSSFEKDSELSSPSLHLDPVKITEPSHTPSLMEKVGTISRLSVTSDSFDCSAIHTDFSNADSVDPPSINHSQGNDYQQADRFVHSMNTTNSESACTKTVHPISYEEMIISSQRTTPSFNATEGKNDHLKEEIIMISSSSDDDGNNEGKINQSITISTISDSDSNYDSQQSDSLKRLLHSSSSQVVHESDSSSGQVSKPRERITIDHLDGFISSYIKGCSQSNQEQNDSLSSDDSSVPDSPLFKQPQSSVSEQLQPQEGIPINNKVSSNSLLRHHLSSTSVSKPTSSTFPTNSLPIDSAGPPSLQTNGNSIKNRTVISHSKDKRRQLMVCFEERLANSEQGRKIMEALRPLFTIGPSLHSPVHGTIVVLRMIDSQYVVVKDGVTILMDGNAMIALIKKKGLKGALDYVKHMRDLLLSDSNQQLYLILTNVQNIISENRKKRRESIQFFTKSLLIELVIRLELDCLISCYMCESDAASIEWITKIIQSMRDIPFAQPLNEFGTVTKKRIAGTGTQDELNDHEAFLYRLLMCVPGVSSTKAMSVLQHYKSVGELMKAYNQLPSQEMKEDMLSDKLGGGSRQRQLSKRIYDNFSTTSDLVQL